MYGKEIKTFYVPNICKAILLNISKEGIKHAHSQIVIIKLNPIK